MDVILAGGDVITTPIEGIGTLRNRSVRGRDHEVC